MSNTILQAVFQEEVGCAILFLWECRLIVSSFLKVEEDHPFIQHLEKVLPFVTVKEKKGMCFRSEFIICWS